MNRKQFVVFAIFAFLSVFFLCTVEDAFHAPRSAVAAETAQGSIGAKFTVVNRTSSLLTLFVDGEERAQIAAGKSIVIYVAVGTHSFEIRSRNGYPIRKTGYVGDNGVRWTITP